MNKQAGQHKRMLSMIETWKTSGLSQKAFCRKRDIAYHTFLYWYKKYQHQQHTANHPAATPAPFLAVHMSSPVTTGAPFAELVLANGKRLLLHHPVDVPTLLALLQ